MIRLGELLRVVRVRRHSTEAPTASCTRSVSSVLFRAPLPTSRMLLIRAWNRHDAVRQLTIVRHWPLRNDQVAFSQLINAKYVDVKRPVFLAWASQIARRYQPQEPDSRGAENLGVLAMSPSLRWALVRWKRIGFSRRRDGSPKDELTGESMVLLDGEPSTYASLANSGGELYHSPPTEHDRFRRAARLVARVVQATLPRGLRRRMGIGTEALGSGREMAAPPAGVPTGVLTRLRKRVVGIGKERTVPQEGYLAAAQAYQDDSIRHQPTEDLSGSLPPVYRDITTEETAAPVGVSDGESAGPTQSEEGVPKPSPPEEEGLGSLKGYRGDSVREDRRPVAGRVMPDISPGEVAGRGPAPPSDVEERRVTRFVARLATIHLRRGQEPRKESRRGDDRHAKKTSFLRRLAHIRESRVRSQHVQRTDSPAASRPRQHREGLIRWIEAPSELSVAQQEVRLTPWARRHAAHREFPGPEHPVFAKDSQTGTGFPKDQRTRPMSPLSPSLPADTVDTHERLMIGDETEALQQVEDPSAALRPGQARAKGEEASIRHSMRRILRPFRALMTHRRRLPQAIPGKLLARHQPDTVTGRSGAVQRRTQLDDQHPQVLASLSEGREAETSSAFLQTRPPKYEVRPLEERSERPQGGISTRPAPFRAFRILPTPPLRRLFEMVRRAESAGRSAAKPLSQEDKTTQENLVVEKRTRRRRTERHARTPPIYHHTVLPPERAPEGHTDRVPVGEGKNGEAVSVQRDQQRTKTPGGVRMQPSFRTELPSGGYSGRDMESRRAVLSDSRSEPSFRASQAAIQALSQAGGRPLLLRTRERFERFFGTSLADVRLLSGTAADRLARAFQAKAVTGGWQIFFAADVGEPESPAQRGLLAHELAHVVQQRRLNLPTVRFPSREIGDSDGERLPMVPLLQPKTRQDAMTSSRVTPSYGRSGARSVTIQTAASARITGVDRASPQQQGTDALDALAADVYRVIRNRLRVEHERLPG
jgi:hypothetical protein